MTPRAFCGHCGADWSDAAPPCSCRVAAERVIASTSSSSMLRFAIALRLFPEISPALAADIATGRKQIGEA